MLPRCAVGLRCLNRPGWDGGCANDAGAPTREHRSDEWVVACAVILLLQLRSFVWKLKSKHDACPMLSAQPLHVVARAFTANALSAHTFEIAPCMGGFLGAMRKHRADVFGAEVLLQQAGRAE